MSERNNLYVGISRAAWAYFFLYFDLSLGGISILPSFVCFLLLLSSIRLLAGEQRELLLLRPLCVVLALWHMGNWAMSWLGMELDGQILFLDLIIGAVSIYFHFQLFTNFAAIAAKYQGEGENLAGRLLRWRTVQTVLCTAISLWSVLPHSSFDWDMAVAMVLTLVGLIAGLCLMAALFALRKLFREKEISA